MTTFSKILSKLRKSKNLSQNKLSKLCGLTSSAISQFESGDREPKYTTLIKLSEGLNVDIVELFGKQNNISKDPIIEILEERRDYHHEKKLFCHEYNMKLELAKHNEIEEEITNILRKIRRL